MFGLFAKKEMNEAAAKAFCSSFAVSSFISWLLSIINYSLKLNSAIDFLRLLSKVQSIVQNQFAVCLVPEIEKVGGIDETCCRPSHTFKI